MKKSKKHLSRLSAYLKKEGSRLEKLIARMSDAEVSPLIKSVVSHLVARREVALADLGLVDAASEAMRKASKAARPKKTSAKKVPKAGRVSAKAPRKSARKSAPKASAKAALAKAAPAKRPVRRKVKVVAPANS